MRKKILSLLCCVFILLPLSACKEAVTQPSFNTELESEMPAETLIAENGSYRLELNRTNMGIILTDLSSGEQWGSSPVSSNGEELDEFGMPVKKHPQVESVLLVKCQNVLGTTEDTYLSYIDAVQEGRIRYKTIENGLCIEFYFDEAQIMIPVEYRLLEDSVTVSIDPGKIQEGDNRILQISLAPFWCSAKNDAADAYLFVPSGSGALIGVDSQSGQGSKYAAQVYGTDPTIEEKAAISTTEHIRLPVFGARDGNKGACAVIDKGAESAWIEATAGSVTFGYSSAYATFQMRGYTNHTAQVFAYEKVENQVYSKRMIDTPVSVRFYPLKGEQASYSGMAKVYREYLNETAGMPSVCDDSSLHFTLLGGTMITKSFIGIPYETVYPATTLSQAAHILSELSSELGMKFSVKLKGFGESGVDEGKIAGGYKISHKVGSVKELNALADFCKKNAIDLYMDYDLTRFKSNANGFTVFSDAVTNPGEQKAAQYYYNMAVKDQEKETLYYLLSPSKFSEAADKLLTKTKNLNYAGFALDTLSSAAYSDYSDKTKSTFYAKSGVGDMVVSVIDKVKQDGRLFMANKPNAYAAAKADIIVDAPTATANEHLFKSEVPFYEIVFKGCVPMVCESVNLAADANTQILRAVESGCGLNYTLMAEWDESLIDAAQPIFYNSVYADLKPQILETVNKLADYYEKIAGAKIINHTILETGLRETRFDNGITVYVNYGDKAISGPEGEIAASDYLVLENRP